MLAALLVGSGAHPLATSDLGAIEGELMFPSCSELPADLQVCAEDPATGARTCTQRFVAQDGYRYRLDLPSGRYAVYAETASKRPGYRAYYSAAVRCGLTVACTDHKPLAVEVERAKTSAEISPADWFANRR